jgi:hypothetical protein
MNIKKYCLAVVAAYIVMAICGIVGSILAAEQLASFAKIGRSDAELMEMMPLSMGAYFVITAIFCYIYVKGREAGDIKEGAKFGIMFGILMSGMAWVYYSALPYEMPALIADNVINIVTYAIGGIVVSLTYKPATGKTA